MTLSLISPGPKICPTSILLEHLEFTWTTPLRAKQYAKPSKSKWCLCRCHCRGDMVNTAMQKSNIKNQSVTLSLFTLQCPAFHEELPTRQDKAGLCPSGPCGAQPCLIGFRIKKIPFGSLFLEKRVFASCEGFSKDDRRSPYYTSTPRTNDKTFFWSEGDCCTHLEKVPFPRARPQCSFKFCTQIWQIRTFFRVIQFDAA